MSSMKSQNRMEDIKQELKANKVFTDRENPKAAFFRKLSKLHEFKDGRPNCVLNYYGIGGMGKTSLKNELIKNLNDPNLKNKLINSLLPDKENKKDISFECYWTEYDFNESTDKKEFLIALRNRIVRMEPKFKMFCFDTVLALYQKLSGENLLFKDSKESIMGSAEFDLATAIFEAKYEIPYVGGIAKVTGHLFSALIEYVKTQKQNKEFQDFIKGLYDKSIQELLDELPEAFKLDMKKNMRDINDCKKPLVIFLDTYEKFTDKMEPTAVDITKDYWLRRGDHCVIQEIPWTMWVILGREKLGWLEDDESRWISENRERYYGIINKEAGDITKEDEEFLAEQSIEFHQLGDLSENDAVNFLNTAGISDIDLCEQLYSLTKGTPVYLDICVDDYIDMINNGKKPEIEDFGSNTTELVRRYINRMPIYYQELSASLSYIGKWKDEEFDQLYHKIYDDEKFIMKDKVYPDFIKHSFIKKTDEGYLILHDTFRLAGLSELGESLKKETRNSFFEILLKNLSKLSKASDLELSILTDRYIEALAPMDKEFNITESEIDSIIPYLRILKNNGDYRSYWEKTRNLLEKIKKQDVETNTLCKVYDLYIDGLILEGSYSAAEKEIHEFLLMIDNADLDELKKNSMRMTASKAYIKAGKFEKAFAIDKEVYKARKEQLGEKHPDTLIAFSSLADSKAGLIKRIPIFYAPQRDEVLKIREQVYKAYKEEFGDDYPDTIRALKSLEDRKIFLGGPEELTLRKQVYETLKEEFGEKHPDTLIALSDFAYSESRVAKNLYAITQKDKSLLVQIEDEVKKQEQVYEELKEQIGENHPDTQNVLRRLVKCLRFFGNDGYALKIRKQVYQDLKDQLGAYEIEVRLQIVHNMKSLSLYEDALEILEPMYETTREQLGESHPDTLSVRDEYASILMYLDRYEEANELNPDAPYKMYKLRP